MTVIENKIFDMERAFYGSSGLKVHKCKFDGPADGESAFKECNGIQVSDCYLNLRYPFWHNDTLDISDSEMTDKCRAALWYSCNINIVNSKLHGIKALRECNNVKMQECDIISPEFGWSVKNIVMENCTVQSEYFMMRSEGLCFKNVHLDGKYSFQYIENSVFDHCEFNTKDAFWHAKNVTVKNSIIKGEYLAWYCEDVTFENCKITGTQPLCYCKGLKLVNCEMYGADLCFEKSEVEAVITTPVISIKNPLSGNIYIPSACKTICDDSNSRGKIIVKDNCV
ncbi:MAG: DUF3737 family protein [Lachnospiraceae bacterium]